MVLQFGSVGNGTIGRHMIIESHGNLLEADVEALVNTVNCVGFMGKGIALQFKQAFPENLDAYQRACQKGRCAARQDVRLRDADVRQPKIHHKFSDQTALAWQEPNG